MMSEPKIFSISDAKPKTAQGSKFKSGETVWLKDTPVEFNRPMKVRYADKEGVTCFWINDVGDGGEMMLVEEMLTLVPPAKPKRARRTKTEIIFTPEASE